MFEVVHDGRHGRQASKIRRQKTLCFEALNSYISGRIKTKKTQEDLKFIAKSFLEK